MNLNLNSYHKSLARYNLITKNAQERIVAIRESGEAKLQPCICKLLTPFPRFLDGQIRHGPSAVQIRSHVFQEGRQQKENQDQEKGLRTRD